MTTKSETQPRKNWLLLLPFIIFLVLSLLFAGSLLYRRAAGHPSAFKDKPVPAMSFTAFNGGKIVTQEDFKGQVTLVNLFAAWCPPCREEHPQLMELSKDKSIKIIGINYKDNEANAVAFLKEHGNPFTLMAKDEKGRQSIELGVYGIPETFIVDKKGIIRFKYIGEITPDVLKTKILPEIEKLR